MILQNPVQIRAQYGHRPIRLMRILDPGMRFPTKLRILFAMMWKREDYDGNYASRFIVTGPRGGGKSKMLGAFGFVEWYLKLRDMVNLGGSLEQARGVYNYFSGHCYAQESILDALPREPTMQLTKTEKGNYYKAVAASQKQVRGPHPHTLVIDEACEAKDDIIHAALPMVSSSKDPLVVMTSTFHKIFGKFQEVWDGAKELGYVRYTWDVIDVTCSFSPDVWKDEKLRSQIPDLSIDQAGEDSLEWRTQGRTGDPEGWFTIENVIQAWREKPSIDWFDVEYMGSRPSAVGLVNKPEDVDACTVEGEIPDNFRWRHGVDAAGGIDWGFATMTSVVGFHRCADDKKAKHYGKNYTGMRSGVIIKDTIEAAREFMWRRIYVDSSAKFENEDLRAAIAVAFRRDEWKPAVIEVDFGTEKPEILGNYRNHFSRRLLLIPNQYKVAIWQHKRYRYQEGVDKPVKKDDHIPDATMCVLKHWPLQKVASEIPVQNLDMPSKERYREETDDYGTIAGGMMDETF